MSRIRFREKQEEGESWILSSGKKVLSYCIPLGIGLMVAHPEVMLKLFPLHCKRGFLLPKIKILG